MDKVLGGIFAHRDRIEIAFNIHLNQHSLVWSDMRKNKVSQKSLNAFADVPLALIRSSVDWKNLYLRFKESTRDKNYIQRDIKQFEKEFQNNIKIGFIDFLDALAGDFNMALFSIPTQNFSELDFAFINRIIDRSPVDKLWNFMQVQIKKEGVVFEKKVYNFKEYFSALIFLFEPAIAITDDYIIGTFSEDRMKSIIDGLYGTKSGFISRIKNNEITESIKNSDNIFWINVKPLLKSLIEKTSQF